MIGTEYGYMRLQFAQHESHTMLHAQRQTDGAHKYMQLWKSAKNYFHIKTDDTVQGRLPYLLLPLCFHPRWSLLTSRLKGTLAILNFWFTQNKTFKIFLPRISWKGGGKCNERGSFSRNVDKNHCRWRSYIVWRTGSPLVSLRAQWLLTVPCDQI